MSIVEPMFKTILPKTDTKELKAFDQLSCEIISRIDVHKINLLPKIAPKEILNHLAFTFGVDVKGLKEEEQRKLIETSNEIYRYIGTPYALKTAFKSLQKEIKIIEWYESNGEFSPYTFGVQLDRLDERGATFVIDLIRKFKNERSWLKQLSDGSCQGRMRLDSSSLDHALLEDVEGIDILGVKVCFKSSRSTKIDIPLVAIEGNYRRIRVYDMLFVAPSLLVYKESVKNRNYRLKRTWTGRWDESRWIDNNHAEIVGRLKNLEIRR